MAVSTNKDHAKAAAEAHTNLTMFSAIISLLEGGTLHGNAAHEAANEIIGVCRTEIQMQLRAYDRALAKLT